MKRQTCTTNMHMITCILVKVREGEESKGEKARKGFRGKSLRQVLEC